MDILADFDRGESIALMEPMLLSSQSRHRGPLLDLALELASNVTGFRESLPRGISDALADLVRSMNCYYSNLIEGHNAHPIDIERALNDDYSQDSDKRNLQIEAKAHIDVQRWIDKGSIQNAEGKLETLCDIHRRFYQLLPENFLLMESAEASHKVRIIPGKLRDQNVKVGQHIAISPGALLRFMQRFETVYGNLGKAERLLAIAAMHHRMLWIHPFLDGNGRVARLMSHATLLSTLDTGGIWSIARGLARKQSQYKSYLMNCDLTRRNDLDGRGHLSEEALAQFTQFFLESCLDQVKFMKQLMRPETLRARILHWAEDEVRVSDLPPKASNILEAVLYRGALARAEVAELLGVSARHARRVVSILISKGVLVSQGARAPLCLAFPASLATRWMPGLFPDP